MAIDFTRAVNSIGLQAINRRLIGVVSCACVLLLLLAVETRSQQRSTSVALSHPNIVLIMTDDMGYADLGSYGGKDIKTPVLDRLARDGVRLTDAYANGVLCSPTRAALISGRYPQRGAIETALGPEGTRGLAVSGSSLPQLLKNGGYRTGLIGKWHLGGTVTGGVRNGGPRAHGFDSFFGLMGSHVDYWHHNRGPGSEDLWEDETKISMDGQYLTTLITERSIQFVEQSASAGQPFFLDVAYNAPHWPYNRPDRPSPAPGSGAHVMANAENPPTRADYATMLEAVDSGVGKILQTVARLGLTDNTSLSSRTTTAASGCRTAARSSTGNGRSGRAGSACRRSSSGPGAFAQGASRISPRSRSTGAHRFSQRPACRCRRATRGSTSSRFLKGARQSRSGRSSGARRPTPTGRSRQYDRATGSSWLTRITCCSTTCARTSASASTARRSGRISFAVFAHWPMTGRAAWTPMRRL